MAWWPTVSSPSDWLFALYNSQENPLFNLSYYSNSVVDSLTRKAWELETTEPKVAQDLYKEIQNWRDSFHMRQVLGNGKKSFMGKNGKSFY